MRIRHSPRMGGAFLERPSVDGAEEPVGVAANLGVSCLAVGHGSLEILSFFVADPPLSDGQARGRLQPFSRLPPRVSLADEVDDAGIVMELGTSVGVRATPPLVLKPVPQRLGLEYTTEKYGGESIRPVARSTCRRCGGFQ